MEALQQSLNLEMVHVPFKGSSQSVPALVSGQVQAGYVADPS
jgi:tripartite-type tricarboxylate transporter receptor subunit TctC